MTGSGTRSKSPLGRRTRRRGPIYAAASMSISQTEHYRECVAWLREQYPEVDIIEGPIEFLDTEDWKTRWPDVRREVSMMVVIPDAAGIIGAGTYQEIIDAVFKHIPTLVLAAPGSLVGIHEAAFSFRRPASSTQFALVEYWESE